MIESRTDCTCTFIPHTDRVGYSFTENPQCPYVEDYTHAN